MAPKKSKEDLEAVPKITLQQRLHIQQYIMEITNYCASCLYSNNDARVQRERVLQPGQKKPAVEPSAQLTNDEETCLQNCVQAYFESGGYLLQRMGVPQ
eukprot:TRINITY_DN2079_c0_g1_i2.p2 TRINITY_DN2079_c0_g1~~TRINITY_DN2079_c0_g1_i2.p2  ORF type:complete len:107 (+),score=26.49 TRINITY_DN2079_c0_g1_i2:27-323(+)